MRRAIARDLDNGAGWGIPSFSNIRKVQEPIHRCNSGRWNESELTSVEVTLRCSHLSTSNFCADLGLSGNGIAAGVPWAISQHWTEPSPPVCRRQANRFRREDDNTSRGGQVGDECIAGDALTEQGRGREQLG